MDVNEASRLPKSTAGSAAGAGAVTGALLDQF
jgi:hypothetical protein